MDRTTALIVPLALALAAGSARAQCEWRLGPHQGCLPNGNVHATVLWDPDGAGPLTSRLVVAGTDITRAGLSATSNIAMYDGTSWQPLGAGLSGGSVFALAVYNGELVAAGMFNTAGALPVARIAKWNGTTWSALGAGLDNTALSLAVFNGSLYAGGHFTTAGGASANRIARWDGANWFPLGTGTSSSVEAMAVLPGALYVGGNFSTAGGITVNYLARWTGSAWQSVNGGANGPVKTLAAREEDNGTTRLYVGGQFTTIGGILATNAASVGFPLGGWNALNTSGAPWVHKIITRTVSTFSHEVTALTPPNASGHFAWRWANPWNALGSVPVNVSNQTAGDELIFYGGRYTCGLINDRSSSVRAWDSTNWVPLGPGIDGFVHAMLPFGSDLIVAGSIQYASGTRLNNIGRWNGTTWTPMAGGTNRPVYTLQVYQGSLYAAGEFTLAGAAQTVPVARWNGTTWEAVGTAGSITGYVYDLEERNGQLLLAGRIDGTAQVLSWNGASWMPMGTGLSGSTGGGSIYTLTIGPDGTLYGGGQNLTSADYGLVRYVPSTNQWVGIGGLSPNGYVARLATFDGVVHAGGYSLGTAQVGSESRTYCLATVTPAGATVVPSVYYTGFGFPNPGTIASLGVYNGALHAVGSAQNVPGQSRADVFRLQNGAWSTVATGADGSYFSGAMAEYQNELYISGSLNVGGNQFGQAWGRWYCPPPCYANCDGSIQTPVLNVADFTCFLQKYAAGDAYGNCDQSTQPPTLNVADFTCYLQKYALGCP